MTKPASDPLRRLFRPCNADTTLDIDALRARLGSPLSYRCESPAVAGDPVVVHVRWSCGCSASGVRYEGLLGVVECASHARTAATRDATNDK